MKIAVASDHTGFDLIKVLSDEIRSMGHEVLDLGPCEACSTDYPIYGEAVGRAVAAGDADLGVIVCGTGVGISLAANRVAGIRAVVCSEPYTAEYSRRHNDSNILALGARVVGPGLAVVILHAWLNAEFEGGRHAARVAMLDEISPN